MFFNQPNLPRTAFELQQGLLKSASVLKAFHPEIYQSFIKNWFQCIMEAGFIFDPFLLLRSGNYDYLWDLLLESLDKHPSAFPIIEKWEQDVPFMQGFEPSTKKHFFHKQKHS
jgi:hypothetical protein